MASKFEKYGMFWPNTIEPLEIELECIRKGGRWKKSVGGMAGVSMFYHWRRAQELLWPDKVWHKWRILETECFLKYKYIGELGAAASGKSQTAALNMLLTWYCFPNCTTILVSSTDLESLENRVWGYIKGAHRDAKAQYEWLPGHLIESRRRIIYDAKGESSEGRDFRNGIQGVPCRVGDNFRGLGCFLKGTMVDTPTGQKPIDTIRPGDYVINAFGVAKVRATSVRNASEVIKASLSNGKSFVCTPEHPILTEFGWMKAVDITPQTRIITANETLHTLSKANPSQRDTRLLFGSMLGGSPPPYLPVVQERVYPQGRTESMLLKILYAELENEQSCLCESNQEQGRLCCDGQKGKCYNHGQYSGSKKAIPNDVIQKGRRAIGIFEKGMDQTPCSQREGVWETWQWAPPNQTGANYFGCIPGIEVQPFDTNRDLPEGQRGVALLQTRHCMAGFEIGGRNRRGNPYKGKANPARYKENRSYEQVRLECIEVLKSSGGQQSDFNTGTYPVYNLEVEKHPSYSVEGVICHNSYIGIHNKRVFLLADELSLMPRALIDSTSNLSKCQNFKLLGLGNPKDTTDSLGVLAEPAAHLGGWEGGIDQRPGTKTWETKYPKGIAIQLPASDTPNNETEPGQPWKYPFLVTPKQVQEDIEIWGRDSLHITMMSEARMPRGQSAHRIITRRDCLKFHAMEEPLWRDLNRTRIAGLDAAYRGVGGDRCVFCEVQFGEQAYFVPTGLVPEQFVNQAQDINRSKTILALIDMQIVPINVSEGNDIPEDQVAKWCKEECEKRAIPPENFFFDSTGRGSLASAFARVWSGQVVGVEFGDKASDRKVSNEIDVFCKDYYFNLRTEMWYSVRLAAEAEQLRGLNEDLVRELGMCEWMHKIGTNKIMLEPKEQTKLKVGRSPDLGDSFIVALEGARRRGFVIARLSNKTANRDLENWKRKIMEQSRSTWNSFQLEQVA